MGFFKKTNFNKLINDISTNVQKGIATTSTFVEDVKKSDVVKQAKKQAKKQAAQMGTYTSILANNATRALKDGYAETERFVDKQIPSMTKYAKNKVTYGMELANDYAEKAGEVIKEKAEIVGDYVYTTVQKLVDVLLTFKIIRMIVGQTAKEQPDAFKFKIRQAKKNAVTVGIFSETSQPLQTIEICSSQGISQDIKYNTWVYL